jgi:hypothetical protein
MRRLYKQTGYSMLELSVSILILGAIAGIGSSMFRVIDERNSTATDTEILGKAEHIVVSNSAISNFVSVNQRFPCPDIDGDGLEDLDGTQCKENSSGIAGEGTLPYTSLSMNTPADRSMKYLVSRLEFTEATADKDELIDLYNGDVAENYQSLVDTYQLFPQQSICLAFEQYFTDNPRGGDAIYRMERLYNGEVQLLHKETIYAAYGHLNCGEMLSHFRSGEAQMAALATSGINLESGTGVIELRIEDEVAFLLEMKFAIVGMALAVMDLIINGLTTYGSIAKEVSDADSPWKIAFAVVKGILDMGSSITGFAGGILEFTEGSTGYHAAYCDDIYLVKDEDAYKSDNEREYVISDTNGVNVTCETRDDYSYAEMKSSRGFQINGEELINMKYVAASSTTALSESQIDKLWQNKRWIMFNEFRCAMEELQNVTDRNCVDN